MNGGEVNGHGGDPKAQDARYLKHPTESYALAAAATAWLQRYAAWQADVQGRVDGGPTYVCYQCKRSDLLQFVEGVETPQPGTV